MFSKKICASLCALGLSLGAANIDTKVSAANTFADIAMKGKAVLGFWNYFKFVIGVCGFMANRCGHDLGKDYGKSGSYKAIACLTALSAVDGFFGMISSLTSEDEAKIKTLGAMAKNDPVYGSTYKILAKFPIELTDENVKGVIDNVKKGQEAYKKINDRSLDSTERLLAKDAYDDAVENLRKIAGAKNSKDTDMQRNSDEPQLYKRRNR